jgi:hypothetical protein
MKVYVQTSEATGISNRYELCSAETGVVIAAFDAIREVDAFVQTNQFTYVLKP